MKNRRLPAEWEEQSAVQLTFPHEHTDWADVLDEVMPVFIEIASVIAQFQKVVVVCRQSATIRQQFAQAHLPNIIFVEADSNDSWARDHAGITIFENDEPVVLDFVFNGWGLKFPADKDNLITSTLFKKQIFAAQRRHGGMVLEGGSIESDGQGNLLTTAQCMLSPNRNPHLSKKQLENRLCQLFGLQRVLWLHHGYLAGDDTDSHIDTLARFCSPDTIAYVRCTDPTDEHFEALRLMEQELQQFRTPDGKPYRLVPLPMCDAIFDNNGQRLPATYANFLIINGAVLLPVYDVPQDLAAVAILESLFPERRVIAVPCRPLILQHGSLHCVTMQFPAGVVQH